MLWELGCFVLLLSPAAESLTLSLKQGCHRISCLLFSFFQAVKAYQVRFSLQLGERMREMKVILLFTLPGQV